MRKISIRTPLVCETQGKIFLRANELGYDMHDFVPKYLTSKFCRKCMDIEWSVYQIWWADESIDALGRELTVTKKKHDNYLPDTLYWSGYMYRLLYFHSRYFSSELIQLIPFKNMLDYYPFLHTLSYNQAVRRILDNLARSKAS